MKVKCSCGAKYEFELRPEMNNHPVMFVCPACGLDASEFVDGLVRQELGQSSSPVGAPMIPPAAVPAGKLLSLSGRPASRSDPGLQQPRPSEQAPTPQIADEAPRCLKHPGEFVIEKCNVCAKPICPKCMELFGYVCSPLCKAKADSHGIHIPVYQGQKSVIDARRWRKLVWASTTAAATIVLLVIFWGWYAWFGCLPKPMFSVRFADPSYSGQSAFAGRNADQIVFLHGGTLARYDLNSGKQIWTRQLVDPSLIQRAVDREMKAAKAVIDKAISDGSEQVPKMPSPDKMAQAMERETTAALNLRVREHNIWVASPGKLVRYDFETGTTVKEVPVQAGHGGFIYQGNELLLVDAAAGKPLVIHVDLSNGETRTEALAETDARLVLQQERKADTQQMEGLPMRASGSDAGKPVDPSKAAAQAQRLSLPERIALPATLAGTMNQQRALNELNDKSHPSAAVLGVIEPGSRFTLIPAKDGFVELSVKLLEARIVARSAMKGASGKPALEGNVTAGNSMEAANDMLNEMQRSNGGDVVQEDHSRYLVTLRRPGSDVAWTGEVIGPPKLYPLDTVNVLAAEKLIIVLDKTNKKLWQSSLAYNLPDDLGALDEESATYGQGPCVERKDSLYVFDAGVLSAFDLATGNARWRLPTVGVAGLFFDSRGLLYVNTTTASHESLKYSRQIDLSRKVVSVILKVDPRNGKILWSQDSKGLVNYVSGKFILTAQSYMPEEREDDNQVDTGFERSPWLRIRRLNPSNGREVWEHYQDRAPLDIAFDNNTIRLVFKKEVQVLRFPSF